MPVFVLNSENNEHQPGDEDPIPEDGNPHPNPNDNHMQHDFWEDVQDLNDVEQANLDEGWVPPI